MSGNVRGWCSAACILAVTVLIGRPVLAGSPLAAEAAFAEGLHALDVGDVGRAIAFFRASNEADPSVGASLNLGRAHELAGNTASAWLAYREALSLAASSGDEKRAEHARQQAERLESELDRLYVSFADETPRYTVYLDGARSASRAVGAGIPVDPGRHELRITAPGKRPYDIRFVIARGDETTTVRVPRLQPLEPSRPARPPDARRRPMPNEQSVTADRKPLTRNEVVALALGGAGAATLGASGYFVWRARDRFHDSSPHCSSTGVCDPTGLRLREEAHDGERMSAILTVVGSVAVGAGVVLWVTAPPRERERDGGRARARGAVSFAPQGVSISVSRDF